MAINSKYFDSIRIGGKKKAATNPSVPDCQWDGCLKPGTHKAPVGRDREGVYFHFCIDHVREYNKSFNYFSGVSDGEIARLQKEALTGNRPTWKTSANPTSGTSRTSPDMARMRSGSAAYYNRMRDPFNLFKDQKENARAAAQLRKPRALEAKALGTLGLDASATSDDIKTKYKKLVKEHHPDRNGGDRASEDRFRDVIQAYQLLKSSGFCS